MKLLSSQLAESGHKYAGSGHKLSDESGHRLAGPGHKHAGSGHKLAESGHRHAWPGHKLAESGHKTNKTNNLLLSPRKEEVTWRF